MRYGDSRRGDWWRKRDPGREATAGKDRAAEMVETMRAIELAHRPRLQSSLAANALYGSPAGAGIVERTGAKALRENVFAQYVDTWMSYIGRACPRPMFAPIDGDSEAIERSRLLLSYTDALMARCEYKRVRFPALRDGALSGAWFIQPYRPRPGAPLQLRRIAPIHVAMDDVFGNEVPNELGIRNIVSRSWLAAVYPEHEEAIRRAPPAERTSWIAYRSGIDAVEVWEAWHVEPWLPEDEAGQDGHGVHCVGFHGCMLYQEPWSLSRIPVAMGRAIPPTMGWWGNSYYDRLGNVQEELNRQTRMEQEIMHTFSVPRWWLPNGSSVSEQKFLKDDIACVIRLSGDAPVSSNPTIPGDIWQRSDRRRGQMSEGFGISQLAASQMKPAGIESAPAFQAYADFQDMRHSFTFEEDAACTVALARACIDLERIEAKRNPSHRVPCASREGGLSTHAWPDLDLDETRVAISVMPAGILPTSPAGRRDAIAFLRKNGLIDDAMVQRLLDAPDINAARSLSTAPEEWIVRCLDAICRGDDPTDHMPEPWMDFGLARRIWAERMAKAHVDGVSEPRIQVMRDWRVALEGLRTRMRDMPAPDAESLGFDTQAAAAEDATVPTVTPTSGAVPMAQGAPMAPTATGLG